MKIIFLFFDDFVEWFLLVFLIDFSTVCTPFLFISSFSMLQEWNHPETSTLLFRAIQMKWKQQQWTCNRPSHAYRGIPTKTKRQRLICNNQSTVYVRYNWYVTINHDTAIATKRIELSNTNVLHDVGSSRNNHKRKDKVIAQRTYYRLNIFDFFFIS